MKKTKQTNTSKMRCSKISSKLIKNGCKMVIMAVGRQEKRHTNAPSKCAWALKVNLKVINHHITIDKEISIFYWFCFPHVRCVNNLFYSVGPLHILNDQRLAALPFLNDASHSLLKKINSLFNIFSKGVQ